ncbi:MAG: hypothetical protein V2I33_20475 [Kangiellaceae bacterium]|jgi:hypothetical protein|nr:hypothetical protein [Kangiellaceae bacterium]
MEEIASNPNSAEGAARDALRRAIAEAVSVFAEERLVPARLQ